MRNKEVRLFLILDEERTFGYKIVVYYGRILNMDRKKIIETVAQQLESELLLGGRWLPVGTGGEGKVELSEEQKNMIAAKSERLSNVADEVAKCQKCQLCRGRINVVPGEGNPDARISFVGEAPGKDEDEQGRPFVGRSGKLLTKIIGAMGLSRDEVFIGNIIKCRPPHNRDPQSDEINACIGYLTEQLEIVQPEIIIALGAHAAKTLLDTNTPIGELRGKCHEYIPSPMLEPIKLIATYHPSYVLRSYTPEIRRKVWDDMKKVLKELDLPVPKKSSRE